MKKCTLTTNVTLTKKNTAKKLLDKSVINSGFIDIVDA